ncbi:hypothetical protein ABT344_03720 [Micromonospora carbonacea]|uniref:hypothetical protein n=1 Tax=Micromonospora carbonacea TaxID=47853 RepID=UPI003319351F
MVAQDIWDRLSPKPNEEEPSTKSSRTPVDPATQRSKRRRKRVARIAAFVFWSYLLIKVFVWDIDYELLRWLFPDAPWVLDLRVVAAAAIFLAAVHVFQKYMRWILYVLFAPFIFTFWYLPRRLRRFFNWVGAIALTSVGYSINSSFKANVTARTAEGVCIFLIAGAKPRYLMVPLASILTLCLIRTYIRALRRTFWPEEFLRKHASVARKILQSGQLIQWASVPDAVRKSRARRLNPKLTEQVTQNLSYALIAIKASHFYAYQLERYRRSPGPFILGMLSYSVLFLYTVGVTAAINVAVFKFSPTEFKIEGDISALNWLHYSLSAFYVNGIDEIAPIGGIAVGVKMTSGILAGVILVTLLLNGFLSYRHKREDEATREAIQSIKNDSGHLIRMVQSEYNVTPSEAARRLQSLGATSVGLILWLSSKVPGNFLDTDPPESEN